MTWSHVIKVEKIKDKTWLDGLVASMKGKLSDDLALMDRSNDEEQVKSRSMNQYGHLMVWRGYFISPVKDCVEKFMTGFRIDGRTIKRGKLICIYQLSSTT
jgi:hypothetical protein